MENIENKEGKVIRRIPGLRYNGGIWKLRNNKEIYEKSERTGVKFHFDKNPKTQIKERDGFRDVNEDLSTNRSRFRTEIKERAIRTEVRTNEEVLGGQKRNRRIICIEY